MRGGTPSLYVGMRLRTPPQDLLDNAQPHARIKKPSSGYLQHRFHKIRFEIAFPHNLDPQETFIISLALRRVSELSSRTEPELTEEFSTGTAVELFDRKLPLLACYRTYDNRPNDSYTNDQSATSACHDANDFLRLLLKFVFPWLLHDGKLYRIANCCITTALAQHRQQFEAIFLAKAEVTFPSPTPGRDYMIHRSVAISA